MSEVYDARYTNIVDGDTIDIVVNQGLGTYQQLRIRLANVDTAETYGVSHDSAEYKRGMKHKQYVTEWLQTDTNTEWPLTAVIHSQGKYGRYITTLKRNDGAVLNDDIAATFPSTSR